MKIKIDIDVTPDEARAFFGLPNIAPLQDEMLQQIRDKMAQGAEGFDAMSFMKPYLGESMQSFVNLQKTFWQAMAGGVKGEGKGDEK